ncbi:PAS domain-containing sensor histidine kinase [Persicimonas caeni]|uniref:PAS domain-containing sensor histidine kinase n=1 Tax=Persicimonas caeni TaxID=2292766 RepID=UPI00143D7E04|nr:PAS domain S-box protein [Persicimonas caeni]
MPSFKFIVEAINEGILLCDLDGKLLYVNERMAQMLGYRVDEMVGDSLFSFMAAPWAERARKNLERRAQGISEVIEHEFRTADDQPLQTLVSTQPIRVTGEAYEASLVAITDISERVKARTRLKRSEESFRTLIENSPEGIVIHRDEQVVYANPAMAELLEYESPADLIGIRVDSFVLCEESRAAARQANKRKARAQRAPLPHIELRLRTRNGERVVVEETRFEGTFDGQPAMISLIRDISQRKRLQARTMALDRLVVAGTLAAGVGHEINNPLAFLTGHLDLVHTGVDECLDLVERFGASDADLDTDRSDISDILLDIQHSLRAATRGAHRIRDIIDHLRMFTRDEVAPPYPIEVSEVLETSIRMASHQLPANTRLVRDYGSVPPALGHESSLGQVLLNMLINAAHAIEAADSDRGVLRVVLDQLDGWVTIDIEDSGVGIAQSHLDRIFDPFFTTKEPDQGTGLGLSISKQLIERMGGELDVDSAPGEGTRFQVRLPAAPELGAE